MTYEAHGPIQHLSPATDAHVVRPVAADDAQGPIRRAVIAGTVGTLIEWFDYALYGAAAGLVINRLFFPNFSAAGGVFAAFATFAVGFVARPAGGIVLAHIGDKYGRRPALVLSITLMGGATVGFGLLPTYAQIGIWAPILLVVVRLIQGFGAGAELAGAITLVAEFAPPQRRAFYTAFPNAAPVAGIALAAVSFYFVALLPEQTLLAWGWRLPFLASGILFLVALYIRHRLNETPAYVEAMKRSELTREKQSVPVGDLLRHSRKELVLGFLSVAGHQANAYILGSFALSYLINTVGISKTDGLIAMATSAVIAAVCTPVMGAAADRWGQSKVFTAGAFFTLLFAIPFFELLGSKSFGLALVALCLGYGVGFAAMAGAQGSFLSSLFPTKYRFSGLALARELSGVLIAGPTPLIAAYLVHVENGGRILVAAYLMLCCLISIIAIYKARHMTVHD